MLKPNTAPNSELERVEIMHVRYLILLLWYIHLAYSPGPLRGSRKGLNQAFSSSLLVTYRLDNIYERDCKRYTKFTGHLHVL